VAVGSRDPPRAEAADEADGGVAEGALLPGVVGPDGGAVLVVEHVADIVAPILAPPMAVPECQESPEVARTGDTEVPA